MKNNNQQLNNLQALSFEYFGHYPHYSDHFKQRGEPLTIRGNKPAAIKEALKSKGEEHALAVLLGPDGVRRFVYFDYSHYLVLNIKPLRFSGLYNYENVADLWRVSDANKCRQEAQEITLYFGDFFKSLGHKTAEFLAREGERFTQTGRAASGYNIRYNEKINLNYWDLDKSGYCLNFFRQDLRQRLSAMKYAKRRHAEELERIRKEAEKVQDQKTAEELRKLLFLEPEKNYCF